MKPRAGSSAGVPIFLFVSATVASWAYCVSTDQFNGDFWPKSITLSQDTLFFVLLAALMPYLVGWSLDKHLATRAARKKRVIAPRWFLESLLFGVFAWHIGMTVAFNVGVMSQEFYNAPAWIKPLIQIGNRIDPFFIGVFYILATPKKPINDAKSALLMITLGLLRAGLGAFAYILIALSIKYRAEGLQFTKRRLPFLVLLVGIVPYVVGTLYDIRSSLRGEAAVALAASDLIVAKLAGRLSSYSNLAYIVQESADFDAATRDLPVLYYPLQIAGSVISGNFTPAVTPEKLLIDVNLFYDGYSTYMAGVPGNLLLAWFVAPWVAALNFVMMIAMIVATLKIAHRFGNGSASSIGIGMLIYPLTSGVSYEFAALLFNMFTVYILCKAVGVMHSPVYVDPPRSRTVAPLSQSTKAH